MLTLGTRSASFKNVSAASAPKVMSVSRNSRLPGAMRPGRALLVGDEEIASGFDLYVFLDEKKANDAIERGLNAQALTLPESFSYLDDGDIMKVDPRSGGVRVLFRRGSKHNSFLLTDRCNNFCLMCSQPPKDVDDSWIAEDVLRAIPLVPQDTKGIGFSGGEPTLLGEKFIEILRTCKARLPRTGVHVLSNGRNFSDGAFAEKYAGVDHPDLMVGIPLYSDISELHDHVVQADGAYDDTIRGILNLKRIGQRVEIRVVIHALTYRRLPELARFIARNLLFVDHVALMGLEITGFTRANLGELWIDPVEYQRQLAEAVGVLRRSRMNVSIYNHQLCVLDRGLWPFARKSISDWKNEYMEECTGCSKKESCGGFFSSAKIRYSDHIKPFLREGLVLENHRKA